MQDKERYELLLDVMAEKIKKQEGDIYIKDIEIENLKKKLAEAECCMKPTAQKLEIRKGI